MDGSWFAILSDSTGTAEPGALRVPGSCLLRHGRHSLFMPIKVSSPVYLNAARDKAVPEGHEDAAFLLIGRNGTLSDALAEKYKVTADGAPGQGKVEALKPLSPHLVNAATPDGFNTAPGTPQTISRVVGTSESGGETFRTAVANAQRAGVAMEPVPGVTDAGEGAESEPERDGKGDGKAGGKGSAKRK